jgi:predicted alpha/beta-fold hydrolase
MQGGDWKAMFAAIQQGDEALVAYYLCQGIDPNYQHPEYLAAPLVESLRFGQMDIAKLLLAHGANPQIKEVMGGATPLSVAKAEDNQTAIRLLQAYINMNNEANGISIEQIEANGMEFTCRLSGKDQGELVILLHGFPESAFMYNRLMQDLSAEGYYCLAPDLRGYSQGARPKGKQHYAIGSLVSDVLELAASTGRDKFHLVGHDWGSAIGWQLAHDYPEKLLSWTGISVPHLQAFFEAIAKKPDQKKRSRYMRLFQLPFLPEMQIRAKNFRAFRKAWRSQSEEEIAHYISIFHQKGVLKAILNY